MTDLEEILRLPELKNARVLGGKTGLDQKVNWMHIIYDANIAPWIEPSTLIYTNGWGLLFPEQDLLFLLKQIKETKAAGIIVERSAYFHVISPKAIQLANELQIPLIEMVGPTNIIELTQSIAYLCFENEKKIQKIEQFQKMIYFPASIDYERDDGYGKILEQLKFPYYTIAFFIEEKNLTNYSAAQTKKKFLRLLKDTFEISKEDFLSFAKDEKTICLIPGDKQEKEIKEKLEYAGAQMEYQQGISLRIGCGTKVEMLQEFSNSIYHAVCALESLYLSEQKTKVLCYEDMGIYRIFFQYKNDQELIKIYRNILGKLADYDKENGSQLIETLKEYMIQNGNLTATAENMFLHKNTLKYRLTKIKKILGIDFDLPNPGFTVYLGYKIQGYLLSKGILI